MSSKLREALEDARHLLMNIDFDEDSDLDDMAAPVVQKINEALAEPLRNCDVGTAEEQTERFKDLCRKYRRGPGPRANCKGCPIQHESPHVGCTFAWAQMPYESEVK